MNPAHETSQLKANTLTQARTHQNKKGVDMNGSCLLFVTDIQDYLGDKVIPNAELWRDKSFFKDGSSFLVHHGAMLGTRWALLSGYTA